MASVSTTAAITWCRMPSHSGVPAMSDGIGWFSGRCDAYFALTFVRGVTHTRLAEMITVEPAACTRCSPNRASSCAR